MTTKEKTSKRITSITVRENAKKDQSPSWANTESMSCEEYTKYFHFAMNYYNLNNSGKELKPKVLEWMALNGYTKKEISEYKATKDWRSSLTAGAIASSLLRGMPDTHSTFNKGRKTSNWLRSQITTTIDEGKYDTEPVVSIKVSLAPLQTIQERVREQSGLMCEEIDAAIDSWIMDPESFDPKAFKMVSLLKGKGVKGAHSKYIKGIFAYGLSELKQLAAGKDEQLKEAYKHVSRKNIKKLIDFYDSIMSACDLIAAETKILKKPRVKKVKPAEELVSKMKFKATDAKLSLVGVNPSLLIGASAAIVYNIKLRKLGIYIASSSDGLSVKGSTLINFTDKSSQKTLRKPEDQLKEFKACSSIRRIEAWFNGIKATDTVLSGRINEDIMILKVFK